MREAPSDAEDASPAAAVVREYYDTFAAHDIGEPGRIEGAAGSRYIEIPVEIEPTEALRAEV